MLATNPGLSVNKQEKHTNVQRIAISLRYIRYYFSAKTRYQIHSPFVYEFAEQVLEDRRYFYAFSDIEVLRKLLLRDTSEIKVTDYGAGSQVDAHKTRKIKSITRYSATSPYFCQVLFRLINFYKPKTLLELGTSMGISTMYQQAAARTGHLITIEGCPHIAEMARKNFKRLQVENEIQLINGRFNKALPEALEQLKRLDYVFIDGNHREAPTLDYFEQCLAYAHENSIFVFDDIHWSEEMEAAWTKIKAHPAVTLSIDLFFCGVVFFRKEQHEKEHFTLIPYRWKPWALGGL